MNPCLCNAFWASCSNMIYNIVAEQIVTLVGSISCVKLNSSQMLTLQAIQDFFLCRELMICAATKPELKTWGGGQ